MLPAIARIAVSVPTAALPAHARHRLCLTAAWRPEGEWLARLDLVEEGERLVVKEMEQVGGWEDGL